MSYLSLPPTRQDLIQGQKPEGQLKWGQRGGEGRARAKTRTLLVCAAHWPTNCNVGLMSQEVSGTQIWVWEQMPGYSLNSTAKSSAIHRGQRLQLVHLKVAQPKLEAFQPWICHWFWSPIQLECQVAQQKPGKQVIYTWMRWHTHTHIYIMYVCGCVCICLYEWEQIVIKMFSLKKSAQILANRAR